MFAIIRLILAIVSLVGYVYGLVLAFQAAVWLGIAALIVAPGASIIGIVALFGGPDLAQVLVSAAT